MSGGHADYLSSKIQDAIRSYHDWLGERGIGELPPSAVSAYKDILWILELAADAEHVLDWAVSGDTDIHKLAENWRKVWESRITRTVTP